MFGYAAARHRAGRIRRRVVRDTKKFGAHAVAVARRFTESRLSPPAKALAWLNRNELPSGGIRVTSKHDNGYPEVTGYIVPTLLDYGERALAMRLVRWLMCIQAADGGYTSHLGIPYAFDTGQVMRGLLAVGNTIPGALECAERAGDCLCRQLSGTGNKGFRPHYAGAIPETIHLYALPPLIRAAEIMNRPDFRSAAESCCEHYRRHPDFLQMSTLTHFLAYELEALIELDRPEIARPVLESLCDQQAPDGGIRGSEGVSWVCSTGLAQVAVCWYRQGLWQPADRAMTWLEQQQEHSGGFRGSYGSGATYFPKAEIPWAAKYFLDAHRLRVEQFFDRSAESFPSHIASTDGRAREIIQLVQPGDRVLEAGCGKGRFLKAILETVPACRCTGVELSRVFLAALPEGVQALHGCLEAIPCPNDSFDVVFSVEAVEHSPNISAAVEEMVRVARPGGWVVIIDKQRSQWGRMVCPPWERWPEAKDLEKKLVRVCDRVEARPIGYDGRPAQDGLMMVWRGRKR